MIKNVDDIMNVVSAAYESYITITGKACTNVNFSCIIFKTQSYENSLEVNFLKSKFFSGIFLVLVSILKKYVQVINCINSYLDFQQHTALNLYYM